MNNVLTSPEPQPCTSASARASQPREFTSLTGLLRALERRGCSALNMAGSRDLALRGRYRLWPEQHGCSEVGCWDDAEQCWVVLGTASAP